MSVIDLQWRDEFGPVLEALDEKLEQAGVFKKNVRLAARALLRLLKHGTEVTDAQVVEYVRVEDEPVGGWVGFDRRKWLNYVPLIVEALKSNDPMSVVKL